VVDCQHRNCAGKDRRADGASVTTVDAEFRDRLQGILEFSGRDWLKGVAGLPGVAVRLIVGIPIAPLCST